MASACCCTRRCAALSCGSDSGPKSRRSFARWSRKTSQARDPPKCERFGEKITRLLKISWRAIGRKTAYTFADRAPFEREYRTIFGVHCRVISAGDHFMPPHRSTLFRPLLATAVMAATTYCATAQQPPTPSRVRGTIEAVDGDVLAVKSRSGEDFRLRMPGDMRVVGIVKIALSEVKVGSFIGATTVPGPDGSNNAI